MDTVEIEKTYLVRELPSDIQSASFKDYHDLYIPASEPHPHLRLRKRGDILELTKKIAISEGDFSQFQEITIPLSTPEYDEIVTTHGKAVTKRRFFVPMGGKIAEIDLFLGPLKGLVLADFEFNDELEKDSFVMPSFCLAEVTQEEFIAGGYLAGKSYEDIKPYLEKYQYQPLSYPV